MTRLRWPAVSPASVAAIVWIVCGWAGDEAALQVRVDCSAECQADAPASPYVLLFSQPPAETNLPIAVKRAAPSAGWTSFSGLSASTVYVSVLYDRPGDEPSSVGPPGEGLTLSQRRSPASAVAVNLLKGRTVQVSIDLGSQLRLP